MALVEISNTAGRWANTLTTYPGAVWLPLLVPIKAGQSTSFESPRGFRKGLNLFNTGGGDHRMVF